MAQNFDGLYNLQLIHVEMHVHTGIKDFIAM